MLKEIHCPNCNEHWFEKDDGSAAIDEIISLLADMHNDDEDCKVNGGEGCLACMCQEKLHDLKAIKENK